jgi:hypothetical protein
MTFYASTVPSYEDDNVDEETDENGWFGDNGY